MFKRILFLVVAVTATMQSTAALAELKVGFINNRALLTNLPSLQKKMQNLDAELAPKSKKMKDLGKDLEKMQADIEKNRQVFSSEQLQAKNLDFRSKLRELKLMEADLKEEQQTRANNIIAEYQGKIQEEIQSFASEGGFDLILTSGVVYRSEKIDVTADILKRMSTK